MTTTTLRPGVADEAAVPSVAAFDRLTIGATTAAPFGADVVGDPVGRSGPVPPELGTDRAALEAAGFDSASGSAHVVPSTGGPVRVAVGIGTPDEAGAGTLRDAGGAFGRASGRHRSLALAVPAVPGLSVETASQALVEGVLLAR
jgi:leucyl aminopeptidase